MVGRRRWIGALLVSCALVVGSTTSSLAAEPVPLVSASSGHHIDTWDRSAVKQAYLQRLAPGERAGTGWTGSTSSCARGTESATSKQWTVTGVNYFRAMAGLPPVWGGNATLNDQALAAALMMEAQNALSHNPSTSWSCYSDAGLAGAQKSNLAIGVTGAKAVHGYMDDFGSTNGQVGHRRWLLSPTQTTIGTGSTNRANALYVLTPPGPRPAGVGWVTWPNAGYVPWSVMPTNPAKPAASLFRWSLSSSAHPGADYSGAKVRMTMDGEALKVSQQPFQPDGYRDNTLIWTARRFSGKFPIRKSPVVNVTVTGIRVGASTLNHSYTVRPFPLGPPRAPKVADPTGSAGAVTVSWAAAKATGTPVTGYRIKLMRMDGGGTSLVETRTYGADVRQITFSGLPRDQVFFGVVEANSKAGWSPGGWPSRGARTL